MVEATADIQGEKVLEFPILRHRFLLLLDRAAPLRLQPKILLYLLICATFILILRNKQLLVKIDFTRLVHEAVGVFIVHLHEDANLPAGDKEEAVRYLAQR